MISNDYFISFITYNRTRLRLSLNTADHSEASSICIENQSKLIEITDNKTQLLVEKLLKSSKNNKSVWIGLKLFDKSLTDGLWNEKRKWNIQAKYKYF